MSWKIGIETTRKKIKIINKCKKQNENEQQNICYENSPDKSPGKPEEEKENVIHGTAREIIRHGP